MIDHFQREEASSMMSCHKDSAGTLLGSFIVVGLDDETLFEDASSTASCLTNDKLVRLQLAVE
jgi:hypothetical protein